MPVINARFFISVPFIPDLTQNGYGCGTGSTCLYPWLSFRPVQLFFTAFFYFSIQNSQEGQVPVFLPIIQPISYYKSVRNFETQVINIYIDTAAGRLGKKAADPE